MEPSLLTAGMSEELAQTRATSSMTMHVPRASMPMPPYCSSTCGACMPASIRASRASCGKRDLSSTSAACGAILFSQTGRMASRSASCSSEIL